MVGRGHPRLDDGLRRRQRERSPREVLADDIAEFGAGDIAGGADAVHGGDAARRYVREVVGRHEFAGVAFGSGLQPGVDHERWLAVLRAFVVDQAEDRGTGHFEGRRFRSDLRVSQGVASARAIAAARCADRCDLAEGRVAARRRRRSEAGAAFRRLADASVAR